MNTTQRERNPECNQGHPGCKKGHPKGLCTSCDRLYPLEELKPLGNTRRLRYIGTCEGCQGTDDDGPVSGANRPNGQKDYQ